MKYQVEAVRQDGQQVVLQQVEHPLAERERQAARLAPPSHQDGAALPLPEEHPAHRVVWEKVAVRVSLPLALCRVAHRGGEIRLMEGPRGLKAALRAKRRGAVDR